MRSYAHTGLDLPTKHSLGPEHRVKHFHTHCVVYSSQHSTDTIVQGFGGAQTRLPTRPPALWEKEGVDHVRLLAKVTAGHQLWTAHLCRCVREGRGHQLGHQQATRAHGSLTRAVKKGARVAEVTNPGLKGKRKCVSRRAAVWR